MIPEIFVEGGGGGGGGAPRHLNSRKTLDRKWLILKSPSLNVPSVLVRTSQF